MSKSIPTLDLAQFALDKEHFVEELRKGFTEFGFVTFTNHSIPQSVIDNAFAAAEAFFLLPLEDKMRCVVEGSFGDRGYSPFKTEAWSYAKGADLKEFYHMGVELPGSDPVYEHILRNVWPDSLPSFREAMVALFREQEKNARMILKAIALSLGENEDFFESIFGDNSDTLLRVLHYPPVPHEEQASGSVRAAPHKDSNLVTMLLIKEGQSGLEVQTPQGWFPITAPAGSVVVNAGEMLEILTNKVIPATIHRVIIPEGEDVTKSRYSIPFFMHPKADYVLNPLAQCVEQQGINYFEQTTPIPTRVWYHKLLETTGMKK